MKVVIALCIVMLSLHDAKAQSYMQLKSYQDTANYLIHEFEMKKDKYVGKPFSTLLNDLKLKPVNLIQGNWTGGSHNKELIGVSMNIDFNMGYNFDDTHFMIVEFKNVPSFDVLYPLFFPMHFSTGAKMDMQKILDEYKDVILTDVMVKDYTQDDPPRPRITDNSKL